MADILSKTQIEDLVELNIKVNKKLQITPDKHKEVIYSFLASLFTSEYNPLNTYGAGVFVLYNDLLYLTTASIDLGEDPISNAGKYTPIKGYNTNQSELDSIDQDLGTTDSPEFADILLTSLGIDAWLGNANKSVLSFITTIIAKVKAIEKAGVAPNTWLNTITELRAIADYDDGDDLGVYATFDVYQFDASSTATDDSSTVIKPNNKTNIQAGRWIVMKQFQTRGLDVTNFNRNLIGITTIQQLADALDDFHLGHILQNNGIDTAIRDRLNFKGFNVTTTAGAIELQVSPIFQYSIDGLTSWHNTWVIGDAYTRISFDNGLTYTAAIYFQPKELSRELDFAPVGITTIPSVISRVDHEQISAIRNISGIDTLRLIKADNSIINIRVGGVNQSLPIDVPVGDYNFNITYNVGVNMGTIMLTTVKV